MVPEQGIHSEAQSPELARLPPGRHGLPRDFVVQNQRDRLTAGMIAVVAERGYHAATITGIAAAAGVSRRTFYAYFDSKEACYLATYDTIVEHLSEISAEAAAGITPVPSVRPSALRRRPAREAGPGRCGACSAPSSGPWPRTPTWPASP